MTTAVADEDKGDICQIYVKMKQKLQFGKALIKTVILLVDVRTMYFVD